MEEDHILFLIFSTEEGKGKLQVGSGFNYGKVRNIEYEDTDSPNIFLDIESTKGPRRVLVDEGKLVIEDCHPRSIRMDIETKKNLIVARCP